MTLPPILISGAGIGGLTAALCLASRGFRVSLIEKRTKLEEVGAGLQLSPNASKILIGLGLGKSLSRVACSPLSLDVRRGQNFDLLARASLSDMQNRYGAPYWVVHRADLQQILLDPVRGTAGITLQFGRTVTAISQKPEGLEVTLSGTSQQELIIAHAVIGADGLHSDMAMVMGDTSIAKPSGYQAWRGTLPIGKINPVYEPQRTTLYLGTQGHAVTYPIHGGEQFNIVLVTREKSHETGWSRMDEASKLHQTLKNWKPLLPLIHQMPQWQVWSLYDRAPRQRWSYGPVTLLGDAAHPVLPFLAQGAALAIEDAATLALLLSQTPDHPAQAFALYQQSRIPRATRVQETARKNGSIYHMPFPLSLARDLVMRRKNDLLLADYDWLYGWSLQG